MSTCLHGVVKHRYNFRPPLWSSGQSSWLQIQRSRVRFPALQKKKVVGLERGPLSLVSTTEELLGRKSSGSCLENRKYGRRDPSHWPRDTLYPQKLAITSPTSGGRSVGIVRSRTQTMEFSFSQVQLYFYCKHMNWPNLLRRLHELPRHQCHWAEDQPFPALWVLHMSDCNRTQLVLTLCKFTTVT
jgi:hypothetical protein